jgi:hypothetical protein
MIELPTPETDALFWKHGYPVKIDTSKAMLLCEKLEKEKGFAIEKYKLLESCFKRAERERDEAREAMREAWLAIDELVDASERIIATNRIINWQNKHANIWEAAK